MKIYFARHIGKGVSPTYERIHLRAGVRRRLVSYTDPSLKPFLALRDELERTAGDMTDTRKSHWAK